MTEDELARRLDELREQLREHSERDEGNFREIKDDLAVIRRVLVEGNGQPALTVAVARNHERIEAMEPQLERVVKAADEGRFDKKSKFGIVIAALALAGTAIQATCNSGCAAGPDLISEEPTLEASAVHRMTMDFDDDGEIDSWCTVFNVGGDRWATAGHCCEDEGRRIIDGYAVRDVVASPKEDVCALTSDAPATSLRVSTRIPTVGERLHFIGYPGSGDWVPHRVVVEGLYSGMERGDMLVTMMVDGGASGSPLMDSDGRVLGIVVASYRRTIFSYAEPSISLVSLLAD